MPADADSRLLLSWLRAGDRPGRGLRVLEADTVIDVDLERAFAFFSDASNLERLTPPWLNFRILTPMPLTMAEGTLIDYRIALYGIPIPWRTRIDVWEPGVRFVDRQVAGPYRWWHHEHRFERHGTGTRVIDVVEYLPRAALFSSCMVERDVRSIFSFRQQILGSLFA